MEHLGLLNSAVRRANFSGVVRTAAKWKTAKYARKQVILVIARVFDRSHVHGCERNGQKSGVEKAVNRCRRGTGLRSRIKNQH